MAQNSEARKTNKAEPEEAIYKNRAQAHRELLQRGYKIAEGKFYGQCNKPRQRPYGLCRVEDDGKITETSLRRYINHPGSRLTPPSKTDDSELRDEKIRLDNEISKERLAILQLERAEKSGRSILTVHAQQDYAALAVVLCTEWQNQIRTMVDDDILRERMLQEQKHRSNKLIRRAKQFSIIWGTRDGTDIGS